MTELRRGIAYYIREEGSARVAAGLKSVSTEAKGATSAAELVDKAYRKLGKTGDDTARRLQGAARKFDGAESSAKKLGGTVKDTSGRLRNARGQFVSAGRGANRMRGDIVRLEASVSLLRSGLHGLRRSAELAAQPVGLAVEFNRSFNEIKTLTDDVTEELRGKLSKIAAEVPQTAFEVTEATYAAISGGVAAADVGTFVKDAADAATAANTSITSTTNALLTATNSFKADALSSAKASDVLFATIAAGITRMDDLASSLGFVTAQAASAGIEFGEVGGAIAAITKQQGGNTAEAVTQLRSLIKSLTKPTRETERAFKAIGFEFGFTRVRADGLAKTLEDLEYRANKAGVEIGSLFKRDEATQAVLKLTGDNAAEFARALDKTTSSVQWTSKALDEMKGDTRFMIDQFRALGEGVLRDLGSEALPHVRDGLAAIMDLMRDDGPAFVESFGDFLDDAVALGKWVAENGDTLLDFVVGFFVAGRVSAMASAINTELLPALTRVGTANIGQMVSMALKSPTVIGLAMGGAYVLGQAIGDAIGDAMTEEIRAAGERAKAETERLAAEVRSILARRGFDSPEQHADAVAKVRSGELVPRTVNVGSDGSVTIANDLAAPAQLVADEGDGAISVAEQAAAAYDKSAAILRERLEANAAAMEAARAEFDEHTGTIQGFKRQTDGGVGLSFVEQGQLIRAHNDAEELGRQLRDLEATEGDLQQRIDDAVATADAQRTAAQKAMQEAWNAPLPEPDGPPKVSARDFVSSLANDKGRADSERREAERRARALQALRDELADRRIALMKDEGARVLAEMDAQHHRELRDSTANLDEFAALVEVQHQERQQLEDRLAQERADREIESARIRAQFIENETARELELRRLQYADDLRNAEEHGADMLAVTRRYHADRERIVAEAAAAEVLAYAQTSSAIAGSAAQLAEELGAEQRVMSAFKSWQMGSSAAEEVANAAADVAAGLPGQAIAHGIAAAAYGAAAVKWGGKALGIESAGGGRRGSPRSARDDRRTIGSGRREQQGGPTTISYHLHTAGRAFETRRDIQDAMIQGVAMGAERLGQQRVSMNRLGGR